MRSILELSSPPLLVSSLLLLASCSGSEGSAPEQPAGNTGGRASSGSGGSPAGSGGSKPDAGGTGSGNDSGGSSQGGFGGAAGAANTGGSAGSDPGDDTPQPEGGCRTQIEANGSSQTVEVCRPPVDAAAYHVRLENVDAGAGHASVQFFMGFDEPPASAQGALAADQFKVMLYSGTPNDVHLYFGDASATLSGAHSFTGATSTLCFDVQDGSAAHGPRIVLWVDGVNGASCSDFATLTEDTAYGSEESWDGAVGPIAKEKGMYLYQAGAIVADPSVALWPRPASSCEVEWIENSEWQRLCEPMGGATHFRLEDIQATTNSRYLYLVLGEDEAPSGAPASVTGDGKLIVTGGQNHMGSSWTWFSFGGESTTPATFSNTAGALYTAAATTACAELQEIGGDAHMAFWATGSNDADCGDVSTLDSDNALHLAEWDAPVATDASNYVKTSNSGITLSRIVVSNTRRLP